MEKQVKGIIFFIILYITVFTLPILASPGEEVVQPYILDAEDISFDYQEEIVTASGKVKLQLADLTVEADLIKVDINKKMFRARGKVELQTPDDDVKGELLEYNYNTGYGAMYGAQTRLDDLRFRGGVIRFLPDQEYELEIEEASFTPCIIPDPHYQIKAKRVLVYPDKKVVGKTVEFWLGKNKLITLPGYVVEFVDTAEGKKLVNPFPLPKLGYNSKKGFSLEYYYPYEYSEDLKGLLKLSMNQSGERTGALKSTYRITPNLTLKEDLSYNRLFNDDEELEEEGLFRSVLAYNSGQYEFFTGLDYDYLNQESLFRNGLTWTKDPFKLLAGLDYDLTHQETILKGNLGYHDNGLSLNSGIEFNLTTREREEKLDLRYRNKANYSLALYQEYDNEVLGKHSYNIDYHKESYRLQLIQREGYNYDYQPYLALSGINYQLGALSTGLSGGVGRVENEGITADRLKTELALQYPLPVFKGVETKLTGKVKSYNYQRDLSQDFYQAYELGAAGSYQRALNERVAINGSLQYKLTTDRGKAVLPDDQIETGSYLSPSLKLTYHLPEPDSAVSLELTGKYSLSDHKLEEAGLKLIRSFDCYSFSLEYYPVEKSFGFSFDL